MQLQGQIIVPYLAESQHHLLQLFQLPLAGPYHMLFPYTVLDNIFERLFVD